jgi:hypothetical protein
MRYLMKNLMNSKVLNIVRIKKLIVLDLIEEIVYLRIEAGKFEKKKKTKIK